MFGRLFKKQPNVWDQAMEGQATKARAEIAHIDARMEQMRNTRQGLSAEDRRGYLQHRRMWEGHLKWALDSRLDKR